jgi:hypothetical protein
LQYGDGFLIYADEFSVFIDEFFIVRIYIIFVKVFMLCLQIVDDENSILCVVDSLIGDEAPSSCFKDSNSAASDSGNNCWNSGLVLKLSGFC